MRSSTKRRTFSRIGRTCAGTSKLMATTHSTTDRIPRLLLVTDRHATAGRDLVDVVARALDAGLPAVQLRDKDLPGSALFDLAERLRAATARMRALLFVNDRVDVARAVGADGVQLGAASLPVEAARALLASTALVGASVHTLEEVAETAADFAVFGPIFETPSKRPYGAPQGLDRLREAAACARAPVLAIGGIEASNVEAVRAAGAHGVAVVRAVLAAADPNAATRTLLAAMH
jgi:thiamine-phosphate pyrophosphorylase